MSPFTPHSPNTPSFQLCKICQTITIDSLVGPVSVRDEEYEGMMHQSSYTDLSHSAETCHLCKLFVQAISDLHHPDEVHDCPGPMRLRAIRDHSQPWGAGPDGYSGLQILGVFVFCPDRYRSAHMEVFIDEDSDAAKKSVIAGRPIQFDPCSEHNLKLIKTWLDHCRENHPLCAPPLLNTVSNTDEAFYKPTRLIDVSSLSLGHVTLIDRFLSSARYIALSHRWSTTGSTFCTTTSNYSSHKTAIPLTSLSPVFLDAIHLTSLLNLRYLWIDSLCIIQDSPDDWAKEAAQMSDVFAHAELAVSALRSVSGDSAFLSPRTSRTAFIPYRRSSSCPKDCHEALGFRSSRGRQELAFSPLTRRGWIFQENILPRRLLSFGETTTFFECRNMTTDAGCVPFWGGLSQRSPMAGFLRNERLLMNLLEDARIDPTDMHIRNKVCQKWRQLTPKFSKLELTRESDRIAAFEGLARRIASATGLTYRFGLWEESIILDLTWYVERFVNDREEWGNPREKEILESAISGQPPSWSWASWPWACRSWPDGLKREIMLVNVEVGNPAVHFFATLDARGKGSMEQELRLRAPLRKCILCEKAVTRPKDPMHVYEEDKMFLPPRWLQEYEGTGKYIGRVALDVIPSSSTWGLYWCTMLYSFTGEHKIKEWYGLVLEPVDKGRFRRLGMVIFHVADYFENRESEIFILI